MLPYCAMLKLKSNCVENYNNGMYFFDGIKQVYFPLVTYKNLENLRKKLF